jgi:glycosyltransferase involved in cell wall biosynthesis
MTPTLLTGGAERQMLLLADALSRDRFEVRFILLAERGPLADQAEARGIPVHSLGLDRARAGLSVRSASNAARALRRYRRIVRHMDVVDAWLAPAYTFAGLLRPLAGVPVLLAGRRNLHDVSQTRSRYRAALGSFALGVADAVVANSQASAADVIDAEGVAPSRVHVIRNAVAPMVVHQSERRRIRASWGVADEDLVVGCVANLKPGKGHEGLLEVASALQDRHPELRYVLIGDGPTRAGIEDGIRARRLERIVIMHGADPNARALLAGFDIAIQTSDTESLPNAVMEAAAAGLPIIATAVGGTGEIITSEHDGILVPRSDVSAMVSATARLADDQLLRRRLGRSAARRATEFSPSRLADETGALYISLVEHARAARR